MYERILVPLDGSELAERVLPYVEDMASRPGSEVILLHAVTSLESALTSMTAAQMNPTVPGQELTMTAAEEMVERETNEGEQYLARICARLRQGLNVRASIVEGAAATAILESVKAGGASIIAMSTHGRGGLGRLVFGSVADEVLRHADVPVLLVRPVEHSAR